MRTSARNLFSSRITHVRRGLSNDEVELRLTGGEHITCILSSERALKMKLEVGGEAVAMIRASSIILITDRPNRLALSARNDIAGVVSRLHVGNVDTEATIALKGQDTLIASVTNEAAESLALSVGQVVHAVFEACNVVLGISA
jgi:molybdate transport system regulatory protein